MAPVTLIMAHSVDKPVLMVTGAYPPDICGVGDYTDRLLTVAPRHWELFVERDWSWRAAPGIIRRMLNRKPAVIVVQYPTQGYSWSIVPHLLVVIGRLSGRYRPVMALHEFTSLSAKARLALALTSHFAAHIIFTTEVERERAHATHLFSARVPTTVIGILSNIPSSSDPTLFRARSIDIAYFGHIRPNKGLEGFLDVVASFRAAEPDARIAVIGEVPKGYEAFAEMVAMRCRAAGITMTLGLSDEAVGQTLADVRILYLPFPDGVTARRGSVLAGFGNGTIVATRISDATPAALRPAVIPCAGKQEDVETLQAALRMSDAESAALQQAGRNYVIATLPRNWAHVVELYQEVIIQTLQ